MGSMFSGHWCGFWVSFKGNAQLKLIDLQHCDSSHDTGLKIATDTVVSVTKTFNLATKNSSLGTTLMTVFLY